MKRTFPLLLSAVFLVGLPALTWAQEDPAKTPVENFIYQYEDADGELHFVDDLTLVPQSVIAAGKLTKIPVEAPAPATHSATPLPTNPSPAARYETGSPGQEDAAKNASASERLTDLRTRREELLVKLTLYEEGFLDADTKEPMTEE